MKDLTKVYPQLTPDERFRLFVHAAARGDIQEVDRLNDSCPRKLYRCEDHEYGRRKYDFTLLSLWHAQQMVRPVELYASLSLIVYLACVDGGTDEDASNAENALEQFAKAMQLRAERVDSWRRFCEKLGLPPDVPVTVFSVGDRDVFIMQRIERIGDALRLSRSDDETVERYVRELCEMWQHVRGTA